MRAEGVVGPGDERCDLGRAEVEERPVRVGEHLAAPGCAAVVRRPAPGAGLGERDEPVDGPVEVHRGTRRRAGRRGLAREHGRDHLQRDVVAQGTGGVLVLGAHAVAEGPRPARRRECGQRIGERGAGCGEQLSAGPGIDGRPCCAVRDVRDGQPVHDRS
jgi:hypothetical protein